jgi:nicotinamidase-related amidase
VSRTLADFFGVKNVPFRQADPREYAHCIIDVQREFCDPQYDGFEPRNNRGTERTKKTAGHINNVAAAFRAASVPTVIVYFDHCLYEKPVAGGGLYRLEAKEGDIFVPKNHNSAFRSASYRHDYESFGKILREHGIKNLMISGFNLNSCISDTVLDALKDDFKVCVLGDCVGNDGAIYRKGTRARIREMMEQGAVFARSDAALRFLKNQRAEP